jgi:hypothetical protein
MIKSTPDSIELTLIQSVYKRVYTTREGQETEEDLVLHKQVKVLKRFERTCIGSVEQCLNAHNKVSKTKCIVYDKFSGKFYEVAHPYEEVNFVVFGQQPSPNPIGFQNVNRVHTRKSQVCKRKRA